MHRNFMEDEDMTAWRWLQVLGVILALAMMPPMGLAFARTF